MELGAVIAERRLILLGKPELDVRVRIGMPRPFDAPSGDYYCPYQITGIGRGRVKRAGGVDAIQALELAIQIIPVELDTLRREHQGLRWADAEPGDYGFTPHTMAAHRAPSADDDHLVDGE
jgi:hypothetical protein